MNTDYTLLPQESVFLAFSGKMILSNLQNQVDTIFLSSADLMQTRFAKWTKENITEITFSPEELDLKIILASIQIKTKARIQSSLNENDIKDEKIAQTKADLMAEDLIKQGFEGKAFTLRQSCSLLETARHIGM